MHELHSALPRPELTPYVRAFAQRRLPTGTAALVEPFPACLDQVLHFEFGVSPTAHVGGIGRFTVPRLSVVGSSAYRPFDLHLCAGVESFAIFLQPLALWQLFRLPLSTFVNHDYDGYAVLGEEGHQLWESLANTRAFPDRTKLAEAYLLRKALNAEQKTPVMEAAGYMFRARGRARLDDIARHLSLGIRQFERNFLSNVGLTPKLFSRVARFQTVLDTRIRRQNTSWARLASDFGYYDQMHMIRDFQKLSGLSPDQLLSKIGDVRPPALIRSVDNARPSHPRNASCFASSHDDPAERFTASPGSRRRE